MIDVLIADDSPSVRELLRHIIESDPEMRVVGTAPDGLMAVALTERLKPHVITMDITMPGLDGFAATRQIMENTPTPIVIVSANWSPDEISGTFAAIEAGALAIMEKPGLGDAEYERKAAEMVATLKLMSEVRVVRRHFAARARQAPPPVAPVAGAEIAMVAIGASTGGPHSLKTILADLPASLRAPVTVVQHIAPGFLGGLLDWLSATTPLSLSVAAHGEKPRPGHVYFAPDGAHMRFASGGTLELFDAPPIHAIRPAVDPLFESAARVFGPRALAVLLSGMGRDGAAGMKTLFDRGGQTIAQDKATSIVHGMPGQAIQLGAARHILPVTAIGTRIVEMVGLVPPQDGEQGPGGAPADRLNRAEKA